MRRPIISNNASLLLLLLLAVQLACVRQGLRLLCVDRSSTIQATMGWAALALLPATQSIVQVCS